MKKGIIFAGMLTAMLVNASPGLAFSDVSGTPHQQAIEFFEQAGVLVGDGTEFRPDAPLLRGEAAQMVYAVKYQTPPAAAGSEFTDVPRDHWAYPAVSCLYSQGYLAGYGSGLFGPADPMTGGQAISLCVRLLGYTPYADRFAADGAPWYAGYVMTAQQMGLLDGLSLAMDQEITRGEMARLVRAAVDLPLAVTREQDGSTEVVLMDGSSAETPYKTLWTERDQQG